MLLARGMVGLVGVSGTEVEDGIGKGGRRVRLLSEVGS